MRALRTSSAAVAAPVRAFSPCVSTCSCADVRAIPVDVARVVTVAAASRVNTRRVRARRSRCGQLRQRTHACERRERVMDAQLYGDVRRSTLDVRSRYVSRASRPRAVDSDHDIKTRVTTLEELKVQRKGDDCLVVIYAPVAVRARASATCCDKEVTTRRPRSRQRHRARQRQRLAPPRHASSTATGTST